MTDKLRILNLDQIKSAKLKRLNDKDVYDLWHLTYRNFYRYSEDIVIDFGEFLYIGECKTNISQPKSYSLKEHHDYKYSANSDSLWEGLYSALKVYIHASDHITGLHKFGLKSHLKDFKDKVSSIKNRLNLLRAEVKEHPTCHTFLRIKKLLQELRVLVNRAFIKQRIKFKILVPTFHNIRIPDRRQRIRTIIRFLFMYTNDVAGCEEDHVAFYCRLQQFIFNTKQKLLCTTKKKLLIRWTSFWQEPAIS